MSAAETCSEAGAGAVAMAAGAAALGAAGGHGVEIQQEAVIKSTEHRKRRRGGAVDRGRGGAVDRGGPFLKPAVVPPSGSYLLVGVAVGAGALWVTEGGGGLAGGPGRAGGPPPGVGGARLAGATAGAGAAAAAAGAGELLLTGAS
ncbi:hypothetical protein EYF80_032085 [Liparis tanakae]|uniref:Uncharacterized protein n=1 Tax=Liparis tanakae TaxID=230148 RepID=A0A4Z2GVP6_9TELE|nr:hypothetical protein EYF80_032085 [Liparis tanakae]